MKILTDPLDFIDPAPPRTGVGFDYALITATYIIVAAAASATTFFVMRPHDRAEPAVAEPSRELTSIWVRSSVGDIRR